MPGMRLDTGCEPLVDLGEKETLQVDDQAAALAQDDAFGRRHVAQSP
jgi:hypothetical protein